MPTYTLHPSTLLPTSNRGIVRAQDVQRGELVRSGDDQWLPILSRKQEEVENHQWVILHATWNEWEEELPMRRGCLVQWRPWQWTMDDCRGVPLVLPDRLVRAQSPGCRTCGQPVKTWGLCQRHYSKERSRIGYAGIRERRGQYHWQGEAMRGWGEARRKISIDWELGWKIGAMAARGWIGKNYVRMHPWAGLEQRVLAGRGHGRFWRWITGHEGMAGVWSVGEDGLTGMRVGADIGIGNRTWMKNLSTISREFRSLVWLLVHTQRPWIDWLARSPGLAGSTRLAISEESEESEHTDQAVVITVAADSIRLPGGLVLRADR